MSAFWHGNSECCSMDSNNSPIKLCAAALRRKNYETNVVGVQTLYMPFNAIFVYILIILLEIDLNPKEE